MLSKLKQHKELYIGRAKSLRRFLAKIISDPDIFQFRPVQDFFLDENEFDLYYEIHYGQESSIRKVYKSQVRFFSSAFQSFKNATGFGDSKKPRIEAKDAKFIELGQEINHLQVFLRNNLENFELLKNGFSQLASNYNQVLGMMQEIKSEDGGMRENAFGDENFGGFSESFLVDFDATKMEKFEKEQIKLGSESAGELQGGSLDW